jgi:hypothetical protein
LILERPNSNNDEYQEPLTYLTYDKKDKNKTKYVLKIFDLEKMNNLSEFIVCNKSIENRILFAFFLERYPMV